MAEALSTIRRVFLHPAFLVGLTAALALFAMLVVNGTIRRPIHSDGWGYYLHLPAALIYGDLYYTFLDNPNLPPVIEGYRLPYPGGEWQGLAKGGAGYLNQYAAGTAVMQLPFFLVALVFTRLTLPVVSGLEWPFQIANGVSAAFYFALGFYFCYRAARLRCSASASGCALAFAALATNLLFYASFDGSFSHIYGFCLVAGISFLVLRRAEAGGQPAGWEFALFGFLIGVATMVRPTNAIVGLLYIVLIRNCGLRRVVSGTALAFAASVLGALPQMLEWFATTGHFIFYSYRQQFFRRLPQLYVYLVSIKKGVFFWHPAYLLMIVAAVAEIRTRRLEGAVVVAIVGLNLYIGASWGDPTFGASFGCRQVVEMIPLLVPPTAAVIARILDRPWRSIAAAGAATLLIAINTIQFQGYVTGKLPHNNANRESYAKFWQGVLGLRPAS